MTPGSVAAIVVVVIRVLGVTGWSTAAMVVIPSVVGILLIVESKGSQSAVNIVGHAFAASLLPTRRGFVVAIPRRRPASMTGLGSESVVGFLASRCQCPRGSKVPESAATLGASTMLRPGAGTRVGSVHEVVCSQTGQSGLNDMALRMLVRITVDQSIGSSGGDRGGKDPFSFGTGPFARILS